MKGFNSVQKMIVVILAVGIGFWLIKSRDVIIDEFILAKEIVLPKEAHNTVGNIPIIEMLDDGPDYVMGKKAVTCDEIWPAFSCWLKFGYSHDVSMRVASGEYLESCEEARKAKQIETSICQEECVDWYVENEPQYIKPCLEMCDERNFIPECDGLPEGKSPKEEYDALHKNAVD